MSVSSADATPGGTGACALILAAGEGRRLRPLTEHRPKALCPVGNVPLLDHALSRLAHLGLSGPDVVAVNASYLAARVVAHVAGRAHTSVEDEPLGTSGAINRLRDWVAGRPLLVGNADAYLAPSSGVPGPDLAPMLAGWNGTTVRILAVPAPAGSPGEFGKWNFAGFSLLPPDLIAGLPYGRSHLVLTIWRPAERAGRLEVVGYEGTYIDTGTPADYLTANLHAAHGGNLVAPGALVPGRIERCVVGAGAVVRGTATRCVILPGAIVEPGELLTDAIRLPPSTDPHESRGASLTVLV